MENLVPLESRHFCGSDLGEVSSVAGYLFTRCARCKTAISYEPEEEEPDDE